MRGEIIANTSLYNFSISIQVFFILSRFQLSNEKKMRNIPQSGLGTSLVEERDGEPVVGVSPLLVLRKSLVFKRPVDLKTITTYNLY